MGNTEHKRFMQQLAEYKEENGIDAGVGCNCLNVTEKPLDIAGHDLIVSPLVMRRHNLMHSFTVKTSNVGLLCLYRSFSWL